MSGNQPPARGQTPFEERDLDDAVLSGDTARVPAARQPATAVMAALRAAPAPGELNGEAAARAAYRLFVLPDSGWPSRSVADPLIAPEAVGRPHSHRRVSPGRWHGRRPAAALLGVAVAAASVVAVVCALTGSGAAPGQARQKAASAQVTASPAGPGQRVLEGGAAPERTPPPSATPAPASSTPGAPSTAQVPAPQALCRQWLAFLTHPGLGDRAAEQSLSKELGRLAGGPLGIFGYCAAHAGYSSRSGGPGVPQLDLGNLPAGGGGPSGEHGGAAVGQAGAGAAPRPH